MHPEIAPHVISLDQATRLDFDIAIIGGGIGGGTAAYALCEAGLRVLLVEKGRADVSTAGREGSHTEIEDADDRMADGRWPSRLATRIDGVDSSMWAPLGCGLGGSSLIYAAALSRLEPLDFDTQTLPDGRTVAWPFSYSDLEPWYERAETIYSVSGSKDPLTRQRDWSLRKPQPKAEVDVHFTESFAKAGLHPYDLHVGVLYKDRCEGCAGYVCHRQCKQDSVSACLAPAAKTGRLSILEQTEVLRIEADATHVTGLIVKRDDTTATVTADTYVCAAGGYYTPVLLLRSRNEHWPEGIGNGNDLVGRNLMFHVSEHVGVWPKGKFSDKGPRKSIALRDFYSVDGKKYGEFQSTGLEADVNNILHVLRMKMKDSPLRHIPMMRQLLRIPAWIGAWLYKKATVFACILEDFPYLENRIVWDESAAGELRVEYTVHSELKERSKNFRRLIRNAMRTNRILPMTDGIWLNYGHPCGSCRSGDDAGTSVLDANCRVHDVNNLYVVDSSFMPTSGGSNPSLTIAANALRVSDVIRRSSGSSS